ncbi:hypothetical protein B0H14DRAFT_3527647 [Mycena olivaceomarginata]|nr:hypothetical protein B0H14DRAFT_3527647 [Mycena olivaceomarginata]
MDTDTRSRALAILRHTRTPSPIPSRPHSNERRSLSPWAVYARGDWMSTDSDHGHGHAGVRARRIDEPDFGYGHGQRREELVIVRPSSLPSCSASESRDSSSPRTIFAIQNEPPMWPVAEEDDDIGLESVLNPEEVEDAGASHIAASNFSHTHAHHNFHSTTHSASVGSTESSTWSEERGPQLRQLAGKDRDRDAYYGELKGDDGFVDVGGEVTSRTPCRTPAAFTSNDSEKEPWIEAEGEGEGQEHVQGGGPGAQRALSVSRDGRGCGGREWEREREHVEVVSPRAAGRMWAGRGCIIYYARVTNSGADSAEMCGALTED